MSNSDPCVVYVLCPNRTRDLAERVLDKFVPRRRSTRTEYEYTVAEAKNSIYSNAMDLVAQLEHDRHRSYDLYWDRIDEGEPRQVMLFFTQDGAMIAGIAVPESDSIRALVDLGATVGATYGMVFGECVPPDTADGFRQLCLDGEMPRLVEGILMGSS